MSGWGNDVAGADSWGGDDLGAATSSSGGFNARAFKAPERPKPQVDNEAAAANDDAASGYGADAGADAGDDYNKANGDVADNTCRYCKKEGHIVRECPDKPANDGACFNCGEQGHNKADCPNPRKFTGTCRVCSQEGHSARECPERPPEVCRNCQQEGHVSKDCTNNRAIDKSHILDRSMEDAWNDMVKANQERDFDDFRRHMLEYMKANKGMKFDEMELAFRDNDFNFYLFGLECEVSFDKVLIGPNGERDAEYLWTLNKSAKPRRSKAIAHRKAETVEENLRRLAKAGTLEDDNGPFCLTCKVKGHSRRDCEMQEAPDTIERVVLKCTNCEALDHRLRDCPNDRKPDYNPNLCRNCGEEGHRANECEKPRMADANTECRRCNGMGHFSKDCPQGGGSQECYNCGEQGHRSSDCPNERVIKCRNCDERGHSAKDCSKPRDITRIKCNECEEMGHYSRNCPKKDKKPEEDSHEEDNAYGGGNTEPAEPAAPAARPVATGTWGGNAAAAATPVADKWGGGATDITVGGDGW